MLHNWRLSLVVVFFLSSAVLAGESFAQVPVSSKDAFFDDFIYQNGVGHDPNLQFGSGQVFGSNVWHKRSGTNSSRAWRRYNWEDANWPNGSTLSFSNSVMTLEYPAGLSWTPAERNPVFPLGMLFGPGTYHTRIRLHEMDASKYQISAFWVSSPYTYLMVSGTDTVLVRDELDLEFNTCFTIPNLPGRSCSEQTVELLAANNLSSTNGNDYFDCHRWPLHPTESYLADCLHNGESLFAAETDYDGNNQPDNRWWNLMIHWEPSKITYKAYSPNVVSWFGGTDGQPNVSPINSSSFSIDIEDSSGLPRWDDMFPVLSMHVRQHQNALPISLSEDLTMEVDWFYYSPELLTDGAVRDEIDLFRSSNLSKVNTIPNAVFLPVVPSTDQHEVHIEGPNKLLRNASGQWKVRTSKLNESYDIGAVYSVQYRYRLQWPNSSWTSWTGLLHPDFDYTNSDAFCSLQLNATVNNYYGPGVDSATKTIQLVNEVCLPGAKVGASNEFTQDLSEISASPTITISPNPATVTASLNLNLTTNDQIRVRIVDILGREVLLVVDKRLDAGGHHFQIDLRNLKSGIYIAQLEGDVVQVFPFVVR